MAKTKIDKESKEITRKEKATALLNEVIGILQEEYNEKPTNPVHTAITSLELTKLELKK